jgi:hypothetical protein
MPHVYSSRFLLRIGALMGALALPYFATAQNVGIGTTAPNAKAALEIAASNKGLLIPRLDSAQRVAISAPPQGLLVYQKDGRAGVWYYQAPGGWQYLSGKGDNLGNHTATRNLGLSGNWLSNNGTATGLRIDDAGNVGVGTAPTQRLTIAGNTNANGKLFLGTSATNAYVVGAPGSIPSGTSARLVISSNIGDGDVTLVTAGGTGGFSHSWLNIGMAGGTNLNTPLASPANRDLGSLSFWGHDGSDYQIGARLYSTVENVQPGLVRSSLNFEVADGQAMRITSDGKVGIGGYFTPQTQLHVNGVAGVPNVRFNSLAGSGTRMVTVDNAGNLTAAPMTSAAGDDLGNHTATRNLDLAGYQLVSSGANGLSVSSSGNVGIGTTTPSQQLTVNGSAAVSGAVGIGTASPTGLLDVWGAQAAAAAVDQQQLDSPYAAGGADNWQSFTAGVSGLLRQLDLGVLSPTGADGAPGTLSIYVGEGVGGTLLTTQPITYNQVGGLQAYLLTTPVPVTAGQQYTYRFQTPTLVVAFVSMSVLNPYGGGRAHADADWDYVFRTHVAALGAPVPVLTALGTGLVGIGTAAPTATLHVAGAGSTVRFDHLAGTGTRVVTTDDAGNLSSQPLPVGADAQTLGVSGEQLSISNGNTVVLPDGSATNEAQTLSKSGSTVTLSSVGGAGGGTFTDADTQTLALNGQQLSISGGNSVTLPPVPAPQTLSLSGSSLTISGGNTVALPPVTDAQTLSLSGSTLSISGGNTVALPPAPAPQTLSLSGSSLTISGGNTITLPAGAADNQQLSKSGNTISLTNGGSVTDADNQSLTLSGAMLGISGGTGVTLPDASSTNELQTLSISGTTLSLSGGNSVTLPSGGGNSTDFVQNQSATEQAASFRIGGSGSVGGSLGVGTSSPVTKLDVRTADGTAAITVGKTDNTAGALYLGNSAHGVRRGYSGGNDVGLYTTSANLYLSANGTSTTQFVLLNNGSVGIGTGTPSQKLEVVGTTRTTDLQVTGGAGAGRVLTSDASGTATWTAPSLTLSGQSLSIGGGNTVTIPAAVGDNLGNHTATQNLNLTNKALTGSGSNLGTSIGLGIRSDGGLNIGQNNGGNVLLGYQTGSVGGSYNVFSGYQSGQANTDGSYNVFGGTQSGLANTSGDENVFHGFWSGKANGSGTGNVFTGARTGAENTTGNYNVAVGYLAGGYTQTGSYNVSLGYNSGPASANLTKTVAIGYNAAAVQSNSIVLGGTDTDAVYVGIGTAAPDYPLTIRAKPGETKLLGFNNNVGAAVGSINITTNGLALRAPLEINGAVAVPFGAPDFGASTITLTNFNHTVRCWHPNTTSVGIPSPGTCPGRVYVIINARASSLALNVAAGGIVFDDTTNAAVTSLAARSRVSIQSDGSTWYVIGY